MIRVIYRSIFITIALSLTLSVQGQDAEFEAIISKVDQYIQKSKDDWKVPGVAIGIIKNDSLVFAKGYGLRRIDKKDKVDENTLYGIASNSKAFTAAAIAILVDEGKVKWDDPVKKHLPYFELYDPYVSNNMTIRDLLCHRSGLKTFSGDLIWYGSNYSRKEVVQRAKYLKPSYGFRSHYGYSNIMYLTAGLVIEAVSGKTWDEFIKERIFIPLGMNNSNTSESVIVKQDNYAMPHITYKEEIIPYNYVKWDNIAPAGAMN